MVTFVLSIGSIDGVAVGLGLISGFLEGRGGGGKLVRIDDVGDGVGDCCLPGVFNISILLLSIKCSLKESLF